MFSILGALALPSRRSTTRRPLTSTSAGTSGHSQTLDQIRVCLDLDPHHMQAHALLPCKMREQTLHSPRRP
jgi:hypothetical protein